MIEKWWCNNHYHYKWMLECIKLLTFCLWATARLRQAVCILVELRRVRFFHLYAAARHLFDFSGVHANTRPIKATCHTYDFFLNQAVAAIINSKLGQDENRASYNKIHQFILFLSFVMLNFHKYRSFL